MNAGDRSEQTLAAAMAPDAALLVGRAVMPSRTTTEA
jgi:hypothetical protein